MSHLGIDTAAPLTAENIRRARDADVAFVGRYLVPTGYSKAIKADEAQRLRDAGLAILLCWEIGAAAVKGGAAAGAADGARALQCAQALGVPAGVTIYFACDYAAPMADYIAAEEYVKAAQAALGTRYRAGLYGHRALCEFLHDRGSCSHFWQYCAWSRGVAECAAVYQAYASSSAPAKAMAARIGVSVDLDTCEDLSRAGLWLPSPCEYDDGEGGVIVEHAAAAAKRPWYANAMDWAAAQGLIRDGRPNDPVTRAELAMVLFRLFGPEDEKKDSGLLSD